MKVVEVGDFATVSFAARTVCLQWRSVRRRSKEKISWRRAKQERRQDAADC
jgi:hypothetical protein